MPDNWTYNQIAVDRSVSLAGNPMVIDKVRVDPPPNSSGIDALYKWICDAEVACEVSMSEAGLIKEAAVFTADEIAHWLRREKYFDGNSDRAIMWKLYTPHTVIVDQTMQAASTACQAALAALPEPRPEYFDLPHTAATHLGYRNWGTEIAANQYGWGDLGGWALDLLQIWGEFLKSDEVNLKPFLTSKLGQQGISSTFDYEDLLADADGWHITKTGGFTSAALRTVLKRSPQDRLQGFYADRFNSSPQNIKTAFESLVDGLDVFCVNLGFTVDGLKRAANMTADAPMPDAAECTLLANALAHALSGA